MKIKLDKTLYLSFLLGILILASLGFTLKESFESKSQPKKRFQCPKKVVLMIPGNSSPVHGAHCLEVSPNLKYLLVKKIHTLKKIRSIPTLLVLNALIPVLVPDQNCQPCLLCGRCPEPAFECKKFLTILLLQIPNSSSIFK